MFLVNLLALFFARAYCEDTHNTATCYYENDDVKILPGEINKKIGYAWATWDDKINSTGTSHIVIETTSNVSSTITSAKKIFCAGVVDGYLMQYRIWNRWLLQKDILNVSRSEPFSKIWTDWMQDNIDYTRKQSEGTDCLLLASEMLDWLISRMPAKSICVWQLATNKIRLYISLKVPIGSP